MMNKRIVAIVVAILVIAGGLLLLRTPSGSEAMAAGGPSVPSAPAEAASGVPSKESITTDTVAPQIAPKNADVTMVMYFDYQCPYCRKVHPVLKAVLARDPKVKLIYRDWPIFGAPSVEAAKAAIASKWQGKHEAFDDALMTMKGKVSSETVRAAASKAGVDWRRLQSDLKTHATEIDALLNRNSQQAAALGLQGTPGFLIGPYLVPGGMELPQMEEAIKTARQNPNGRPGDKQG
jgi:protein-disulfide isomerase